MQEGAQSWDWNIDFRIQVQLPLAFWPIDGKKGPLCLEEKRKVFIQCSVIETGLKNQKRKQKNTNKKTEKQNVQHSPGAYELCNG